MAELPRKDYYGILRLPFGASDALIKQRFKRLAKRFHPDVNPSPTAAEEFREIRGAYDVLRDPASRSVVDSWYAPHVRVLRRPRTASVPPASPVPPDASGRSPTTRSPSRLWTAGSDRGWSFGCFSILTFLVVFFALLSLGASLSTALSVSALVALGFGIAAAIGGERVREALLWVLAWFWW